MAEDPTDHELLLRLGWDLNSLKDQLVGILTQLSRGNVRFEQIALNEQRTSIELSSLRSDFSRAILSSDIAQKRAEEAFTLSKLLSKDLGDQIDGSKKDREEIRAVRGDVKDIRTELDRWKSYLKIIGLLLAPIQIIVIAVAVDLVKKWLLGS